MADGRNKLVDIGETTKYILDCFKGDTPTNKEEYDNFAKAFKHMDYLVARIQNDHKHNESIEYTTIDLDEQISSLHKKIIRKYGQRFVSMLEDVDKRKVDNNFKQLLIEGTDTILDEGYLGYIPSQSQEYNKALYHVARIVNHSGPFVTGQNKYKGSRYNVMVEWLYGDHQVTEEKPLLEMVR